MDIWLLHIAYKNGEDITVHSTEERAKAALCEFVDEEMADDPEKPDDQQERIDEYFSYDGRSFYIAKLTVDA
jgi:hypothetical protein